jgi:transposase-like protein
MKDGSASNDIPGPARRGHVVQRVIVDGWTTCDAARAAGVDERSVARWVADYRRRGMASLRQNGHRWNLRQRFVIFLRTMRRAVLHWLGAYTAAPPERPSALRRRAPDPH